MLPTLAGDTGHNVLVVEFFRVSKATTPSLKFERLIFIDNRRYSTKLELPRISTTTNVPAPGAYPMLECGAITYNSKNDLVHLDFSAWHDSAPGTYALQVTRGTTALSSLAQSGPVTQTQTVLTKTLTSTHQPIRAGHLLGTATSRTSRSISACPRG